MTLAADLAEYVAQAGAAQDGAAPLVFWDAYGLENAASGIGSYGRELAQHLLPLKPAIVGTRRMTADFCGWPRFLLDGGGYVGRVLFSKPVWPRRVAALPAAV